MKRKVLRRSLEVQLEHFMPIFKNFRVDPGLHESEYHFCTFRAAFAVVVCARVCPIFNVLAPRHLSVTSVTDY